jgi:hypothetical protein
MKPFLLRWRRTAEQWPALTLYQRFESAIALTLTLTIAVVILVSLYRVVVEVVGELVLGALPA